MVVSLKSSSSIPFVGGQCYVILQLYWHAGATVTRGLSP